MLDFPPDWTFVFQFCGFFALLVVLDRLLFRPFISVLDRRDASTHGAAHAAEVDRSSADVLRKRIEAGIADAKAVAHSQAEGIRRETQVREAAIFEQAKAEVEKRLGALRAELERESTSARESLRVEARSLADAMVAAVLEKKA
jgi:F-type H+-transporting ATPase subunit b